MSHQVIISKVFQTLCPITRYEAKPKSLESANALKTETIDWSESSFVTPGYLLALQTQKSWSV